MIERVFVVRTAFDPAIQKTADEAIESSLRQFGRDYNANQAAIHELPDHVRRLNPANRFDVGSRDRLLIRDDRKCFHHRGGKFHFGLTIVKTIQPRRNRSPRH